MDFASCRSYGQQEFNFMREFERRQIESIVQARWYSTR
jgi:hypothetical protein